MVCKFIPSQINIFLYNYFGRFRCVKAMDDSGVAWFKLNDKNVMKLLKVSCVMILYQAPKYTYIYIYILS